MRLALTFTLSIFLCSQAACHDRLPSKVLLPEQCESRLAALQLQFPHDPFRRARLQTLERHGRFYAIRMSDQFVGEDKVPQNEDGTLVTYLRSPQERARYRLVFKGGLIYQADGVTLYNSGLGYDLFVMDTEGAVYASPPNGLAHSSYLAGGDVTAAGKLRIVEGVLIYVSNESGHYLPPMEMIYRFLHYLADQELDLSQVELFEKRITR